MGDTTSPVKELRRALAKRAKVAIMDEIRTCMLASIGLSKKRKHNDKPVRRRHYFPLEPMQSYPVCCCSQNTSDAGYWDRDIDATIDIVNLLQCEQEHGTRMRVLMQRT